MAFAIRHSGLLAVLPVAVWPWQPEAHEMLAGELLK
jgi:hypothetical protein